MFYTSYVLKELHIYNSIIKNDIHKSLKMNLVPYSTGIMIDPN